MRFSDWSSDVCSSDLFVYRTLHDALAETRAGIGVAVSTNVSGEPGGAPQSTDRLPAWAMQRSQSDLSLRIDDARSAYAQLYATPAMAADGQGAAENGRANV